MKSREKTGKLATSLPSQVLLQILLNSSESTEEILAKTSTCRSWRRSLPEALVEFSKSCSDQELKKVCEIFQSFLEDESKSDDWEYYLKQAQLVIASHKVSKMALNLFLFCDIKQTSMIAKGYSLLFDCICKNFTLLLITENYDFIFKIIQEVFKKSSSYIDIKVLCLIVLRALVEKNYELAYAFSQQVAEKYVDSLDVGVKEAAERLRRALEERLFFLAMAVDPETSS